MKKPEDTEDKESWYKFGEKQEIEFLENIVPHLKMDIKLNPEKEADAGAIDFVVGGKRVDLKKQETPFFKSKKLYGLDPQYCVTFNTNDYRSYIKKYAPKNTDIIFWVDWKVLEMFGINIKQMHGVWLINLEKIQEWVKSNKLSVVRYKRRIYDRRGNAPTSYLLNLLDMKLLVCFKGPCTISEP